MSEEKYFSYEDILTSVQIFFSVSSETKKERQREKETEREREKEMQTDKQTK